MKKNQILVFLFYTFLLQATPSKESLDMINKLNAYTGKRTFLLSYPRSGEIPGRGIVWSISPEDHHMGDFDLNHHVNFPLGLAADFKIDLQKAPIEKVHQYDDIKKAKGNIDTDDLILIVRNPKEVLSADLGKDKLLAMIRNKMNQNRIIDYFTHLNTFAAWKGKKILIYYEDLVQNPKKTLGTAFEFS